MRRCSSDCARTRMDDDEKGIDSMHIDNRRICPQRFADDAVLPKPCIGWRYSRPPAWMGCNDRAERLYNGARSIAMRREMSA